MRTIMPSGISYRFSQSGQWLTGLWSQKEFLVIKGASTALRITIHSAAYIRRVFPRVPCGLCQPEIAGVSFRFQSYSCRLP